jgi:hypothetical protein
MKKIIPIALLSMVFGSSCMKNTPAVNLDELADIALQPQERKCASYEVLQEAIHEDSGLKERMENIERFTQEYLQTPRQNSLVTGGILQIPVVVNVLYRTAAENISLAQIQSQIDVLNEDYAATNADHNATSTYQTVKSGDVKVRFKLDTVIRKSTTKTGWTTNNAMKKSSTGGINPSSPTTKLNIWVCTLTGGVLGYAQFPGGASATDGVVILNTAFGRTGSVQAPFHKGRTATHEIGHWLNLRHIWGDALCGDDLVGDTPLHDNPNMGCPAAGHRSACAGTPVEMTMNFMDYTDDACMYMFSLGQAARMQASFALGGPRASFR